MINVVVIEDLENYRNVLQYLLNGSEGFTCVGAWENAESAIKEIPELAPDVAMVDINLPGMNGIELVKQIRRLSPPTLCMMCTAYEDDEKVFKALEAGAYGYVLKSLTPTMLLESVVQLINGGSPMSNEVARKVVMTFQRVSPEIELTKREAEVLGMLSQGLLYKEIAAKLFISLDTVRRHCFNIYTKLHVKNKTEAINKYLGKHRY